MQSFKEHIRSLWSLKSDLEEIFVDLQDLSEDTGDEADKAARILEDAFDLIEEAAGVLAKSMS